MKGFAPRFAAPLDVPRPRGARLLEAFSPKLGRRVRLFDRSSFDQWIRLEADPSVLWLCERPARLGATRDARLIDFWIQRVDGEQLMLLDDSGTEPVPQTVNGVPLHHIAAAELAAAAMWIANWQRMLPVIVASRALLPEGLMRSVLTCVHEPVALSRIEHELSMGDPPVLRGAIFELLRTGQLRAPSLHNQPLSLHTLLEPAT